MNLEIKEIKSEMVDVTDTIQFSDLPKQVEPKKTNSKREPDKSNMSLKDDCDFLLLFMNKNFNPSDESIPYLKGLKKRIQKFKKEVYSQLTAEDKCLIKMLDTYSQKLIFASIKDTIGVFAEIDGELKK